MAEVDGKLVGKIALITGASSGIGEALVDGFVAEGAAVALVARRLSKLEEIASRVVAAGGKAVAVAADVSEAAGAQAAVQGTCEQLGGVDILVNSAGVSFYSPAAAIDPEHLQAMIQINLLGSMFTTRCALDSMRARGGGHVVNLSSVMGRTVWPGFSAGYSASKWGIGGFSEALRIEGIQDNIRVTLIEPGAVHSDLHSGIPDPAIREQVENYVNEVDALLPADVTEAVMFAVTRPPRVSVNEILIRPFKQEF